MMLDIKRLFYMMNRKCRVAYNGCGSGYMTHMQSQKQLMFTPQLRGLIADFINDNLPNFGFKISEVLS